MTSGALPAQVWDADIAAETPVLLNRPIFYTDLPVPSYGDARWSLAAARFGQHLLGHATINWDRFPPVLREAAKHYVFVVINTVEDAPRLVGAKSPFPSVTTILREQGDLRYFACWLAEAGRAAFAEATTADLHRYLREVTDSQAPERVKRDRLGAVMRLHAYRRHLPDHCRLPAGRLWGGARPFALLGSGVAIGENRTRRIHPEVMAPLLSAALFTCETIAADVMPVAQRLLDMRRMADRVAPAIRRGDCNERRRSRQTNLDQLERLLPAMHERNLPLPGTIPAAGRIGIDFEALALAGWLNKGVLEGNAALKRHPAMAPLRIEPDWLRVTDFSDTANGPWRASPVPARELPALLRHVITAAFLVTAYLSGARTGEVLNLERGCVSRDNRLDLTFMSGNQLKTTEERRHRSPKTIPWVVTDEVAEAVAVLEQLTEGDLLFRSGQILTAAWYSAPRCRAAGSISKDIAAFVDWFNTDIAPAIGHPSIGRDPSGPINAPRLRRTLAWHIVRRPGGTVAGATQYGHLRTQITHGYAGNAASGFTDELAFEEFLSRAEQLHDDHQRLASGEHVSGPAAEAYRQRVRAATAFEGTTITTNRQAAAALAHPDLQIHHGSLLTCVYRPQTAACRTPKDADEPNWPKCRTSCQNIAYTDRDIEAVSVHARELATQLEQPKLPLPLRVRLDDRRARLQDALAEHRGREETR